MNSAASTEVVLGLIAIITLLSGGLVYIVKNYNSTKEVLVQSTAVNNAVNNVGPGESRIYDMVLDIKLSVDKLKEDAEARALKGWDSLPSDLANAPAVVETIREIQHDIVDNLKEHERVAAENLKEHKAMTNSIVELKDLIIRQRS
jgi:hypothetical protein